MINWNNHFLYQMEPEKIVTSKVHLFGTILYLVLGFITIFYLIKIRRGFINANQWKNGWFGRAFFGSVFGLFLLFFNFFITKLSLFLSNGKFALFYQQDGFIANIGFSIFFILFPYCGLVIINVDERIKKISFILLGIMSIITLIALIFNILGVLNIIQINRRYLIVILGLFLISVLILMIITLFFESRNSFSRMNKVRLKILTIGLLLVMTEIIGTMMNFIINLLKQPNLFILWFDIFQPMIRIMLYTLAISSLYLSFFFPLWFQKLTKTLPPSFKQLMLKRKSMENVKNSLKINIH